MVYYGPNNPTSVPTSIKYCFPAARPDYFWGPQDLIAGVSQPKREARFSPTFGARIMNEQSFDFMSVLPVSGVVLSYRQRK
jgi:hypothetical protein